MSRTPRTFVQRRGALAMAALLAVPVWSNAQLDGTWAVDVGTVGGQWSDASNWVDGVIAGQGGTATFMQLPFSQQPLNIYQDLPTVELSAINFTGPFFYLLRPTPSTTNSLTLTGSAVIHTALPHRGTGEGHRIHLPIEGSSGLTKTGPGLLTLRAANSFTGAVNILGGTLRAPQSPDAVFGAPGNEINFNGGTFQIGSSWTTSRTINLVGDGTITTTTGPDAVTLNGPITGAGTLFIRTGVTSTVHNTYSGATIVDGGLGLSRDGAIPNTPSLTIRGGLSLDNRLINHTDRVPDSAPVTIYGGSLTFSGNELTNSIEHLGPVTVTGGLTIYTRAASTRSTTLSLESLSRENGAIVFFRADKTGQPTGAIVSNVMMQQPPALVGGGGGPGSTNISIIPWAFGNSSGFFTDSYLPTSGLVTYGPTGVRPLNINTEYATSIAAAEADDNVRLNASEELAQPSVVNALVVANGLDLTGPGTLTISSGLLLSVGTATTNRNIRAPLEFGNTEALILTTADPGKTPPLLMSGPISGSGGLNKHGAGSAIFDAANTYTGTTRISGGDAVFINSVPASGPGPFGSDTSPIVLANGQLVFAGGGAGSFDRNLLVADPAGETLSRSSRLVVTTGSNLTVNGNIDLQTSLSIGVQSQSTITLAGTVSGGGDLTDSGSHQSGIIIITGDNTFTGNVRAASAMWALGSDTALGTGIILASPGTRIRAHGGPRTISNEVVGHAGEATPNSFWSIRGDQPITFTGNMNLGGIWYHGIDNTAVTTYAGTLHSGGLDKYAFGTLVLSGNNVYAGPTIVTEGVLRIVHHNALGTTDSPTTVRTGASLEITGGTQSHELIIAAGSGFLGQGAIRSFGGHNGLGDITGATGQFVVNVVEDSLTVGDVELPLTTELRKEGPGRLAAQRYRGGVVQVFDGIAGVTPGRSDDKTSVLLVLNILSSQAQFDLADNDLVIDHFSNSPLASIRSGIVTAYADGAWTGAGITSSLADDSHFALGYAESTEIFTAFPASFSGVLVDETAVLVRYTRYGDADLNGVVNLVDFNRLATNFGGTNAVWSQGDFNYDGVVDVSDFNLFAASLGLQASPGGPTPEDWSNLASAVPEPGGIAGMAAICLPLLVRRTRARAVRAGR